jgi:hypothetical protein
MVDKLKNEIPNSSNFQSLNANLVSNSSGYRLRCSGLFQFEFENSNTTQKFHFHCFLKNSNPRIAEVYLLSPLRWDDGKDVSSEDAKSIHQFLNGAFYYRGFYCELILLSNENFSQYRNSLNLFHVMSQTPAGQKLSVESARDDLTDNERVILWNQALKSFMDANG